MHTPEHWVFNCKIFLFIKEDAAERFERMQKELQLTDIESVPYRAAKIRSDRRVSSFIFSSNNNWKHI